MRYKISTISIAGNKLYFNHDYAVFTEKFPTEYKSKKDAEAGLTYARKCAPSKVTLDNLKIEKI